MGASADMTCELDPRPFAAVLHDWMIRRNAGRVYGARKLAARELRHPDVTIHDWLAGRSLGASLEALLRRTMDLIDEVEMPYLLMAGS